MASAHHRYIEFKPKTSKMISVKPDILEKLKCSVCSGYLSCAPIYETADKKRICGRCPAPGPSTPRAELYETLAEMMSFPCKNNHLGCEEGIPFNEQTAHDLVCEFLPYECPVTLDGSCDWEGPKKKILEHCETQHPQKVILLNPSVLRNNIVKNSFQAYLITAFGELFLVHIKVCLRDRKVYHCLRYVGEDKEAKLYSFKVAVCSGQEKITKTGIVAPQGTLKFNNGTGVVINVDSLLDVFGTIDEFVSKITVYTRCVKCNEGLKKLVYHVEMGWICSECIPVRRECKNHAKGCPFIDIDKKSTKHEYHFCAYSTWCWICRKDVVFVSLSEHRVLVHASITYRVNTTWRATLGNNWQHCIVSSQIGNLLCSHWLNSSMFQLRVGSPLESGRLDKYCCVVIVMNPETGEKKQTTAKTVYDNTHDWLVTMDKDEFLSFVYNEEFNVKIKVFQRQGKLI